MSLSTAANTTTSESASRTIQVLAVGDCNTGGITNPPVGNTILDKFCRFLECSGYSATSQNLGFGMGSTREGVELVRRAALPADVVLINFGLVDTWVTSIPRIYIQYYPENPVRKRLRKLLKFVKRRLRSPMLRRFIPVGHVVPIDEYEKNIRVIIKQARFRQPAATVLLWGSPPVQHDTARNANLEKYNQRLRSIAHDTDSQYVDTRMLVTQLPAASAYVDEVHLNEAATEAIAEQLAHVYRGAQLAAAG